MAGACIVAGIITVWTLHYGRAVAPVAELPAVPRLATRAPAPQPSVLWLLSIGVSRYRQASFNLQFAAADAQSIASTLQRQGQGPLYRDVKTLVLTDEQVTRESILTSLDHFLGQAGPDDVAAIFVAGHGVQDQASGSYYFLPFAATVQNLVSVGLRMSDFDEMVRVVRHNVRGVVVMLDTCHAGALRLSAPDLVAADDPAARMSAGEGFFLLAATKPGEDSIEEPALGHGAFTYALLEGLQGGADADSDGMITVSDLFSYVARRVPQLTGGAQHPYHKEEGTDLVFAAAEHGAVVLATAPMTRAVPVPPLAVTPSANTIGVMEFRDLREEPEHDWIGKALRVALNTELSKVRALRVYSPELIDRSTASRRVDYLTAAQRLGIRKLLTGSFHVVGSTVRIDAEIVDTVSGVQEGSDSVQGDVADFFALQKTLVLSMLRRLRVELSADEGASIEQRTNTNVDAYRLLLEAEGLVNQPSPSPSTPEHTSIPGTPQSWWHDGLQDFATLLVGRAFAAEPSSDPAGEVRAVIEAYRFALEHKDLDKLAALYVSFSARQRDALRAYLDNASGLTVEFADVTVEPRGDEVLVSYTRRDRFVDRESGKPQHLEVRLTKILTRENGTWKITGAR